MYIITVTFNLTQLKRKLKKHKHNINKFNSSYLFYLTKKCKTNLTVMFSILLLFKHHLVPLILTASFSFGVLLFFIFVVAGDMVSMSTSGVYFTLNPSNPSTSHSTQPFLLTIEPMVQNVLVSLPFSLGSTLWLIPFPLYDVVELDMLFCSDLFCKLLIQIQQGRQIL